MEEMGELKCVIDEDGSIYTIIGEVTWFSDRNLYKITAHNGSYWISESMVKCFKPLARY